MNFRSDPVVISPVKLGTIQEAARPEDVSALAEVGRQEVLAGADRDGVTLASEIQVRILVEVTAYGYGRQPGDGLLDEEWRRLVLAHEGRRPLAFVRFAPEESA